ncbi:putative RNA-directed DNA polymerase [Helianthus annuus]|nr:putative RNA-directed DNA polymerase [Helianthus annuus]
MTGKDDSAGPSQTLISKLDIGDPLFLHPSDSSSLTIVSIKLKGTENYRVWSSAMKLALEAKNKFGFIDGKCKKNTEDDVLSSQWDRCNSVVLSWLLNSVSEELYLGQVFSKLASEVWTDLKETYDKVDGSIVYDLYKKINCITQNGSSVSEYYHKLNTMWKQFDAVLQLPTCSCQAAKDFNDFSTLIKLMQFLMGLDDIYHPVRTNLLTREPLPSVKVAFSIVSREESHRNSSNVTKNQSVSFVAKTNQSFDQRKREFKGPNPNFKCTHCNKIGHTVDRCFEVVGYPQGFKKKPVNQSGKNMSNPKSNASSVPSSSPFSPEQVAKILSLLGEKSSTESQPSNIGGANQHMDLKSGKALVTGKQDNGLYFVSKGVVGFEKQSCEICHRAKQVRTPFPLSEHKSKHVGDLIHLDVWGPYRVTSRDGFKYFLTVVDDYSRVVWCYLLKSKIEVFENIESFYELILTQFKKRVKVFRSDNGTEFVNHKMDMFCKSKGILHQTTCAYTPQQNGVVERKHRHLLNLARSLLFQSGVPLSFWSDCVLTAVYIINRLPSSVLLGKSPFELMFGFKPSFAHFRIFGCLCFSTILNDTDKMSFNAEKCVMIGYSNVKKGYKLWSLVSWKSKKQSTVARSTAEAEYRAMCSATCELMWLRNLLSELNVNCDLPMSLNCDSQAAISIAANPVFHERTKHFELDLHFLREKLADGVISTVKVDTENQLADILTKGLTSDQHELFCNQLGLIDMFKPIE